MQFRDAGVGAGPDEALQAAVSPVEVGGGVEVAQFLTGDPHRAHIAVGVAGVQAGEQPGVCLDGEVFGAVHQDPAAR